MRLDHLLSKELDTVGCENGWINPTKTEEEVEEKPAKAEHYLIIQVDG